LHKLHVLALEGDDRDGTQAVHMDRPVLFAYVPAKQFEHAPTPVKRELMVPAAHIVHELAPAPA
jgi:hypothetical protein